MGSCCIGEGVGVEGEWMEWKGSLFKKIQNVNSVFWWKNGMRAR